MKRNLSKAKVIEVCKRSNSMAMAAAAIHLAATTNAEKVSQLKISKISGISAVTIRERRKEIVNKIGDVKVG